VLPEADSILHEGVFMGVLNACGIAGGEDSFKHLQEADAGREKQAEPPSYKLLVKDLSSIVGGVPRLE
jgi:hypothetical protein